MNSQGIITISYNGISESHTILSLDKKYTNGRNFEILVYNFLKKKGYNMTLSDSHPMYLNFRFFNLANKFAFQIGNYCITGDGGHDLVGDKNGIQIFVQTKSSKTGKYSKLKEKYEEFENIMEIEDLLKKLEFSL
ncbi:21208_t:CDS:1 [Gigaspora margarita]|uniref:21208_t:CDS:1 n=1 Tax=Gigaspora margarita TaxID=4874 RepID=A0ABN7V4K6_GIGMA|nr:21208_t:CDS:1 [Gigaspora margarita]